MQLSACFPLNISTCIPLAGFSVCSQFPLAWNSTQSEMHTCEVYMFTEFWQCIHRNNTNLHQDKKIIPLCQPQLVGQDLQWGPSISRLRRSPTLRRLVLTDALVKSPWWLDKQPSGQQACLRWGQVFWSHICEQFPHSFKATSILKQTDPPEAAQLRELCREHPYNHQPDSTINISLPLLYHELISAVHFIVLMHFTKCRVLFLFLLE